GVKIRPKSASPNDVHPSEADGARTRNHRSTVRYPRQSQRNFASRFFPEHRPSPNWGLRGFPRKTLIRETLIGRVIQYLKLGMPRRIRQAASGGTAAAAFSRANSIELSRAR